MPNISQMQASDPHVLGVPVSASKSSRVFHRKLDHKPLFIERAEGIYLYEEGSGRRLMDGCGGAAVVSVGHCVPEIVEGVRKQLEQLSYITSATFAHRPAEELADMLCQDSGMARALFLTGGSEAMESAIKLCCQYHVENGQSGRINFIARAKSYHGTTLGTLSLGRHERRRALFTPLFAPNFHAVSPCYAYRHQLEAETDHQYVQRLAQELEDKFQTLGPDTVAAFFMEPIVGATTGCVPFVPGYMKAMREICHRHGALFVLDEIMCGFGRTGKLHAWEWEDCHPDVQVLGKGINGGYSPLSTVLMDQKVVNVFRAGSGAFANGYTYQSSAIGCRAALECYKYLKKHNLVEQCHRRGLLLGKLMVENVLPLARVGDVRGKGLFWGVEFVLDKTTKEPFPASTPVADLIVEAAIEGGLVVYPGMKGAADGFLGDHIMVCPPYTISEEEIHWLVDTLVQSIKAVLS